MSLLKRISDLVRSNVNDILDKAEDPRKILEQTILDMEGEHKKAKKMLLETLTLLKQSEKQAENYKRQSEEWEQKAMAALKSGHEDLARQALSEKQKVDDLLAEAQQGVEQQTAYTNELKRQLGELERKIDEAKKKRDELIARLSAAEMKKKQAQARTGEGAGKDWVRDTSAFDTFERMVEKIENAEAEVEARRELLGNRAPEVEAEINKHFEEQNVDAALEALKAKMASQQGGAPAPRSDGAAKAGDEKAAAIEAELAALRAKLEGGSEG